MEGGGGGGEEKLILVRSISTDDVKRVFYLGNGGSRRRGKGKNKGKDKVKKHCNESHFHLVDLNRCAIQLNCLPPLIECLDGMAVCDTMVERNGVYIVGGFRGDIEDEALYKVLRKQSNSHTHDFYYVGASRLDFDKSIKIRMPAPTDVVPSTNEPTSVGLTTRLLEQASLITTGKSEWVHMPCPISDTWCIRSTSLNGRLYNFGYLPTTDTMPFIDYDSEEDNDDSRSPFRRDLITPEVFDPACDHKGWQPLDPLPEELLHCRLSNPLLPDPRNNRILMHLSHGFLLKPGLYAFYPGNVPGSSSDKWECLEPDFPYWTFTMIAVDGVIYYFYSHETPLMYAYDTSTRKWLVVNWSQPLVVDGIDLMTQIPQLENSYLEILLLADGIFCLVMVSKDAYTAKYYHQQQMAVETSMLFLKLRFERGDGFVTLSPISGTSFVLPKTTEVPSIIAV